MSFLWLLALPLYFVLVFLPSFAFTLATMVPVLISGIFRCKWSFGRFMNPLIVWLDIFLRLWLWFTPLSFYGLFGECQRRFLSWVAGPIGLVCNCIKKSRVVPEVRIQKLDERVSVVTCGFFETLESLCTMTVIRHDDYVLFYNPVFCSGETYKKLVGDAKRVFIFLGTKWHHMATDIALEALPEALIVGCAGAASRHKPKLEVVPFPELDGCTMHRMAGTSYDDHLLYFEPSKTLLVGDFTPGILDADYLEIPAPLFWLWRLFRDRRSMTWYQRVYVQDVEDTRAVLEEVLKHDIRNIIGVHPGTVVGSEDVDLEAGADCQAVLRDFWGWLGLEEAKAAAPAGGPSASPSEV